MLRRSTLIAAPVLATGLIAAGGIGTAVAAPSSNASCVAQITTNPDFGPAGHAHQFGVNGHVVSFIATHGKGGSGGSNDCLALLFEEIGGP
jgi:hypothetical protein